MTFTFQDEDYRKDVLIQVKEFMNAQQISQKNKKKREVKLDSKIAQKEAKIMKQNNGNKENI